jgi:type I restriction enzyme R subunit
VRRWLCVDEYDSTKHDLLKTFTVNEIGLEGMKIDRMYFEKFEDKVKEDDKIKELVQQKDFDAIEQYIISPIFDKTGGVIQFKQTTECYKN